MKKISILLLFLLYTINVFAQIYGNGNTASQAAVQGGVGLGTVIAVVISWSRNESILWAILHGILGWFYVIYFAIVRQQE